MLSYKYLLIQGKKMSSYRSIRKHIQLVVQSNDFEYVKKSKIKDPLWGQLFRKFEKGEPKELSVSQSGLLFSDSESVGNFKKPIQKVKSLHVNNKGLFTSENGLETFPAQLYREFVDAKPEKLGDFIQKHNFCAFPLSREDNLEYLDEKYKEITKNNLRLAFGEKDNLARMKNVNYLLSKHLTLQTIVNSFDKNRLNIAGLNWLNNQIMPNVSPVYLDEKNYPLREIEDDEAQIENILGEFLETKKVSATHVVLGYRVFGHFALCCLELLNDIEKEKSNKKCKFTGCNKTIDNNSHGNTKYCSSKCRKKAKTELKKIERDIEKRKTEKKIKRKLIPKRNFI